MTWLVDNREPLQVVKESLIYLADTIFGEDYAFDEVHTVWFDNYVSPHVTMGAKPDQKEAFLRDLRDEKRNGGTDFLPCFKYIKDLLNDTERPDGSRFSIVFLTDGKGSYDQEKSCPDLKKLCTQLARENDTQCVIYSLGFS